MQSSKTVMSSCFQQKNVDIFSFLDKNNYYGSMFSGEIKKKKKDKINTHTSEDPSEL